MCFAHSSLGTHVGSGCVDAFNYHSGDIQDVWRKGLGGEVGGLGPEQQEGWQSLQLAPPQWQDSTPLWCLSFQQLITSCHSSEAVETI